MQIGISTAWNADRHKSGRKMVREILALGFDTLELSRQVTERMIGEIEPMIRKGEVQVCSLHANCPAPEKTSGRVAISSTDDSERLQAVEFVRQTIEWAAKLGAKAVVIHSGDVPSTCRQIEALKLIGAGFKTEGQEIVAEDMMERNAIRNPYVESVIAGMRELAATAESLGVKLGLETRYMYNEVPSLEEFGMIFEAVPSPALGYWHDTGHAQTMETLGVAAHEDFLKAYGDRLIGMHVHDAIGASDHRALGRGQIDFPRIMEYVKDDTAIVLEIHGQASEVEIIRSREVACRLLKGTEK